MIINTSSGCESCVHVKQYEGLSDCNRILGDTPKNNHLSALGGVCGPKRKIRWFGASPRTFLRWRWGGGLFRVSATLFLFFVQGLGSDRYDYLGSCLN